MSGEYKRYYYQGPVYEFGNLVDDEWYGETVAKSPRKALANLIFQWKKKNGRSKDSYIRLSDKSLDWEV